MNVHIKLSSQQQSDTKEDYKKIVHIPQNRNSTENQGSACLVPADSLAGDPSGKSQKTRINGVLLSLCVCACMCTVAIFVTNNSCSVFPIRYSEQRLGKSCPEASQTSSTCADVSIFYTLNLKPEICRCTKAPSGGQPQRQFPQLTAYPSNKIARISKMGSKI